MIRTYIATHEYECPARWALAQEGVEHEVLLCDDAFAYGNHLADLWNRERAGFILIEHDIVPWPGAIQQLAECPEPRCVHATAVQPGTVAMLGLTIQKIIPRGPANEKWRQTKWDALDGEIIPEMNRYGFPHVHTPPVAHARRVPASLDWLRPIVPPVALDADSSAD